MVAGIVAALLAPSHLAAQQSVAPTTKPEGFWLTTAYPEMTLRPGETESVSLSLRNQNLPPQRAAIEVSGVPEGWDWTLKGGGREVSAVIVGPDSTERLTLELTPPDKAPIDGEYSIQVRARTVTDTISLPLVFHLSETEEATAGLSLEPELPALRGTTRTTFSFKIRVKNEGPEEALFNLSADLPDGFRARFKKGFGSDEITGLPIASGATETVTMEVIPARTVAAGRYPVGFRVSGNGQSESTELSVELAGEPQIAIVGPQERLSGEAVAGEESSFTFTLVNTGSAPATDLEMSATPPSGWNVAFEPEAIATLAPNASGEVNVRITPSEQAIAGDYMVTVRTSGGPVSDDVRFRVTVRTATLWGAVGLGVIAIAALILGGAVMRYGRR